MTFKDRTSEFTSVLQNVRQSKEGVSSAVGGINHSNRAKKGVNKSQFFVIAAQIGKDITETAEKLDRLTKLAKRKSLFDDPAVEIQELTAIINQDIKNLNNQITTLQQGQQAKNNKQTQTHSVTIVDSLKSQLRTTTKDFSEVLELRTENLKVQQREKENFTGSQSPVFSGRRTAESPLYKITSNQEFTESSSDVAISMPQNALLTQERYISNRADAMVSVERTIAELQGIFHQLASMVAEQGELIERIDHNVDSTVMNVDRAQNELLKYLGSVSSNRWLIVKIFLVLVLFIVLFVVFFV